MGTASGVPLRVGLIGVGRHGSRYLRHLLLDVPEAKLVALCRRTAAPVASVDPAIPCYSDYRRLIGHSDVEAVIAVTPPVVSRDICLAAVQAKKPLLVEKPLASTAADAVTITRAAQEAGIPIMTGHTMRFDPTIMSIKDHCAEAGPLRYVALTSRMEPNASANASSFGGRGILLEIGIHLLDLIRFLTAQEVVEVRCRLEPLPPAAPECLAFAWLRLADGVWVSVDVSRVSSGRVGRVEWVGAAGQLEGEWQARRLRLISAAEPDRQWSVDPFPTVVQTLRSFVRSVREKVPPPISGEDGKRAVEIAEACYLSAGRNGEAVPVRYQ